MCIFDSSTAKPETHLMDILYWWQFHMRMIGRHVQKGRQKILYTIKIRKIHTEKKPVVIILKFEQWF